MARYRYKIVLVFLFYMLTVNINAKEIDIEYLVPDGFSAAEQNIDMKLFGMLNGKALPGPFYFSEELKRLSFNTQLYRDNAISESTIQLLERILSQLPYMQCVNGCDYMLIGYRITLDKINQSLNIIDGTHEIVMPATTWGFVHNQSIYLGAATNHYRAMSINGQGYIGLPAQSFSYINWFYNRTHQENNNFTRQGISNWYLQKNFPRTYLRLGQKNNLDSQASVVHTLVNPWLDQFITLGSQHYFTQDKPVNNTLVLYAVSSGDYEFYHEGRLIHRIPAQVGRNTIDYDQLPGGYYDLDIRLIDSIGHQVSQEKIAISNIDYQGSQGWFITSGRGQHAENLLQFGQSINTRYFQYNFTLVGNSDHQWATEGNISRPMEANGIKFSPTFGVLSSEKNSGGYGHLRSGNRTLGYLTLSHYQHPDISIYVSGRQNSHLSYSRNVGSVQLNYRLNDTNRRLQQSIVNVFYLS
ncbi:TcfC E-set like domain-containing protein [Candidatus Fukatsuia symbiotica]|uniref:Pilus assembly protein E-set like domain-containing protein n=2 Tax=Candidatus Fukatsuia symbiotica TaxID=1878942 RepID=A0A2U8I389_9GAMM|nr:TcfC E-set like domain-containing protein [Candidatus Fukatsuia symbiotica]AWK13592.1 hypothetical protein CCS41_02245 [Candidatus Fukatsuia symbiotica]MEA9445388.1 TcfC E-set like domain-containing protein [Candidatus Fukatsuia symbiotica]